MERQRCLEFGWRSIPRLEAEAAGLALEQGPTRLFSEPIDRYQRPYEGHDASRAAMQAYLDWEAGLVAQLALDGTHHFQVT